MIKKKVVVTGATGLVGASVLEQSSLFQNLELIPWFRTSNNSEKAIVSDLLNYKNWEPQLSTAKPDVLIHCAAESHVDRCAADSDACQSINVQVTKRLVEVCNELGTHFIFVSSDFVFAGDKPIYHEDNERNPVNFYGETKVKAEKVVSELSNSWSIVRTILVYGAGETLKRNNILTWVVNSLRDEKPIKVVDDQIRMPTYNQDLAEALIRLAINGYQGVFHISGSEQLSVCDFAKRIAKHYGLDEHLISPISTSVLNEQNARPLATGFNLDKARIILNYIPKSIEMALENIPIESIKNPQL